MSSDVRNLEKESNFARKRASQDTSQTRTNDPSQSKVQFPSNISFFWRRFNYSQAVTNYILY